MSATSSEAVAGLVREMRTFEFRSDGWEPERLIALLRRGSDTLTSLSTRLSEQEAELAEARAEIDRCHARLEIDHIFRMPKGGAETADDLIREEVPMSERASMIDGISCRDETIKLLDKNNNSLKAEVGKLRVALEQIAWHGTVAGMHEQDRAGRLQEIARQARGGAK